VIGLPPELMGSAYAARLQVAFDACFSVGAALMVLRGREVQAADKGDQLKSSVDRAAEGWVLGYLRANFADDRFLAEESFDDSAVWDPAGQPYWTVDALDGTRSYIEGFDGFCVQVAYVYDGVPVVGVICEPVRNAAYVGVFGQGAWRITETGAERLLLNKPGTTPETPRFIDSIPPTGIVGAIMERMQARFVECGSIGLKIARVADGNADVFSKRFRCKLWDVAPGQVIVGEAGAQMQAWSGPIDYRSTNVFVDGVVCAGPSFYEPLKVALRG
jgi:3'(2'), 5'-bisphosphate nucleotidase